MSSMRPAHDQHNTLPYWWIGQTAIAASGRGVPINRMMLRSGFAEKTGAISGDTRVDPAEFHLICNLLITTLDDELHGAGKARMMRGTGALGLQVMASAPTLRAGLNSLIKLYQLAGTFCDLELIEGRDAELRIRSELPRDSMAFVIEEVLANWLYVQLCFLLQSPLKLSSYATTAQHPNAGGRHAYFGCPVVASKHSSLRFPKYYLDMPPKVRLGDAPLLQSVMYWLEQVARQRQCCGSLYEDKPVSLSVLELLGDIDLTFAHCSDALSASERDVRHALSMEGSNFRELRRLALVNRVRPMLNASANLDDVAASLGYSDARSLRRGLKAATGLSISRLRTLESNAAIFGSPKIIRSLQVRLVAT
jgi:AraC-like DNA-binding protein